MKRIKWEIEYRMLTQSEVARMAGMNRQRVHTLLNGTYKSLATIREIWKALGLEEKDASR